jgi:hypothetical protein
MVISQSMYTQYAYQQMGQAREQSKITNDVHRFVVAINCYNFFKSNCWRGSIKYANIANENKKIIV